MIRAVEVQPGRKPAGRRPPGRHRYRLVLPAPPDDHEKYAYINRNLGYLVVVVTLGFITATISQVWFEFASGMWPFALFTAVGVVSFGLSLPLSFAGRGFDLAAHQRRVTAWAPDIYPDVDIYLPVCGEPLEVLRNTWAGVWHLVQDYPGIARPYVLDDAADPAARDLALSHGFGYLVRADRPWMKKSGNLRHAFGQTIGEFILILDADFVPRPDFLAETLPYFDDRRVAIVQTPQYFRTLKQQTWVERAAGAIQETFYRNVQVARDRLGASICVGTCAVYRRRALEPEGGTTLIAYAEDVHTGLDARRNGWDVRYVPVIVATGMCPDNIDAFVRQQYRWCTGSTSTILTRRLWTVPMSRPARLTYVAGFCYYLQTALATFAVPLFPLCLLILRPHTITPENSRLIIVALCASLVLVPIWNISSYRAREVVPLSTARGWAHVLAIWDYLRRKTMAWQASGSGVSQVRRFRIGVAMWNIGAAATWLGLAVWRTVEFGSPQFVIVIALGTCYAAGAIRVLIPPRKAAAT
jgi:cellulose synthase/poly-beta-1,6-N-acetylglucosamine synthase-like glycosyltransferase